jgi:hypothetical protein
MLNNFGVIEFGFWAFWSLWPLILILWGISILPIKDGIKIVALVGVLAFTVIFFERLSENSFWNRVPFGHWHNGEWDNTAEDDTEANNYQPQNLSVPFDSLTTKGVLELEASAGNFNLEGVTSDFLSFNKTGDIGNYSLTTSDENNRKNIVLSLEKSGMRHSVEGNKVDIRLNQLPSWNLDFDIGAAEINMDLRDYRIDSTTINAGASSIKIQVGEKTPLTVMTFNAGASSITVDVPRASGCQITSESFMVSKAFEGFTKTGNGIYQTDNYKSAGNKVQIIVKTAVSKIEVNRY